MVVEMFGFATLLTRLCCKLSTVLLEVSRLLTVVTGKLFLSIGQEKPVSLTSVLSAFEFLFLPQQTFSHSFQCWADPLSRAVTNTS